MLIANSLAIAGRHQPLLEPTSLTVSRGQLLLVQAQPQTTRTALSLGLSARMRPSTGTVSWSGNTSLRAVRRISALVDSPEINEPEAHLKVRDLVAEDLALQPVPLWRRSSINAWLERHHLEHLADSWLDAIDPLDRLTLITRLSLEDHHIELAIFDSPDRHGIPEDDWLNHLQTLVGGRRAPAVIAVVNRIPEGFDGAVAYAGAQQDHPIFAPVAQKLLEEPARIDEPAISIDEPATQETLKPVPEPEQESAMDPEPATVQEPAMDPEPAPELSPALEETR